MAQVTATLPATSTATAAAPGVTLTTTTPMPDSPASVCISKSGSGCVIGEEFSRCKFSRQNCSSSAVSFVATEVAFPHNPFVCAVMSLDQVPTAGMANLQDARRPATDAHSLVVTALPSVAHVQSLSICSVSFWIRRVVVCTVHRCVSSSKPRYSALLSGVQLHFVFVAQTITSLSLS